MIDSLIFRDMSYGVYVTTSMDGKRPVGCVSNSNTQTTSSPAMVTVSLNHDNYTTSCIARTGKFAFSILSEQSDPGLIGSFGFRSSREADKFEGIEWELVEGMPVLKDACGYVVCRVAGNMETPTHTIFLGEVIEAKSYGGGADAMTYSYYHKVIKGKAPKNAPTYIPERDGVQEAGEGKNGGRQDAQETPAGRWVCQVCGYVYEGDTLPADFKCPICGQGADKFKRV